jgi:flagellar hook-basal body complex protein FliE
MTSINRAALTDNVMAMRNAVLAQNQALRVATQPTVAPPPEPLAGHAAAAPDFTTAMRGALAQVNALQDQSRAASEAFERGETSDIASVMLARQKASVGFEATMQVRNKLLSAYSDIMNMPL